MVTSADLETLANTLPPPNDEIMKRAAYYLAVYEISDNLSASRDAVETAHNLVTDVAMNLVLMGVAPSVDLLLYEDVLSTVRIDLYGSIGRETQMTPPQQGW